MNKTIIRIAVYGFLLATAVLLGATGFLERQKQTLARIVSRSPAAAPDAAVERRRKYITEYELSDLAMDKEVPYGYPRPASEWLTSEKAFYEKILAAGKFEVMVVPFQVQQWGFDRATRSLMTAMLAAAVAQVQSAKVPDPYLVARALGDGQRQFKPEDIYRLVNAIGVKRIIWGYTGHDQQGKMRVTVMVQDHSGTRPFASTMMEPATTKKFANIPFDDEHSPIAAYELLLPEIIKAIGLDATALAAAKPERPLTLAALPDTPLQLMAADGDPARDAYTFLLLAGLTPNAISRTKERFVEKAFLALRQMSPASPEYRALRARAYMMMSYRPAAIKALGVPQTSEEIGLLSALNGNLADVRAMVAQEKNPLKRLLLKLDEVNIANHYDVTNSTQLIGELKALGLPGNIWPFLVARAFTEEDAWVPHENTHVKTLLDLELPLKGYSLEDIARAAAVVGDADKLQSTVELSVFNHGRKFVEVDAAKWCCQFSISQPGMLDYMDLLQAMGHDNLIRRITFQSTTQGRPESAMQYANTLDVVYRGYPYYAIERSKAELKLAANASDAEKQGLRKSAHENAFNAMYWEQGQSHISHYAQYQVKTIGNIGYGVIRNFYDRDIPYRPYYWTYDMATIDLS